MAERDDGWIEWSGGPCPVHAKRKVVVKFREDPPGIDYDRERALDADTLDWRHLPGIGNIIAYRVVKS